MGKITAPFNLFDNIHDVCSNWGKHMIICFFLFIWACSDFGKCQCWKNKGTSHKQPGIVWACLSYGGSFGSLNLSCRQQVHVMYIEHIVYSFMCVCCVWGKCERSWAFMLCRRTLCLWKGKKCLSVCVQVICFDCSVHMPLVGPIMDLHPGCGKRRISNRNSEFIIGEKSKP